VTFLTGASPWKWIAAESTEHRHCGDGTATKNKRNYLQDGAPKIAKSVAEKTMVSGRYNELVHGCFHGAYKPTFTSLGGTIRMHSTTVISSWSP